MKELEQQRSKMIVHTETVRGDSTNSMTSTNSSNCSHNNYNSKNDNSSSPLGKNNS